MRSLRVLTYVALNDASRRIIVLDGQPYYESTGDNSKIKGTWLPFIMIRGTQVKRSKAPIMPEDLSYFPTYVFSNYPSNYIIKAEYNNIKPEQRHYLSINGKQFPFGKRIATTRDLANSIRLGGGMWKESSHREDAIHYLRKNSEHALIELANTPQPILESEKITKDPDKVNEWLINQGAHFINNLFGKDDYSNYIVKRQSEERSSGTKYRNWYGVFFGVSSDIKLSAAIKITQAIAQPNARIIFFPNELDALTSGELGKITRRWASLRQLPRQYIEAQKQRFERFIRLKPPCCEAEQKHINDGYHRFRTVLPKLKT